MLYFAYGSNMSTPRLARRLPIDACLGPATVPGHEVVFHKVGSNDGSGKAGLIRAGQNQLARGVLFEIAAEESARLDLIEGVGQGYERVEIAVHLADGASLTALSYLATRLDESLRPFYWYKHHLLCGAREHDLPADYIDQLVSLKAIADPDERRHEQEMAVYLN